MPTAADVRTLYTTPAGPGNVNPQPAPGASLGGYASHTPWPGGQLDDLFDPLTAIDLASGRPDHRCLYVCNNHPSETARDARAYLSDLAAGGSAFDVGADPTPASFLGDADPQASRIASETEAPAGVVFLTPSDYGSGVPLGDLPAGSGRALWVRRRPGSAAAALDSVNLWIAFA